VGYRNSSLTGNPAAFSEVSFKECAMAPAEPAEGMEGFDHAGALGPPAARAGCQSNHGDLSASEGGQAGRFEIRVSRFRIRAVHHIARLYIFDHRARREAVLAQANASVLQVRADLFVLEPVETVLFQQGRE